MHIETPNNSYADILQRLVRRYLFKLERQKEEGNTLNVSHRCLTGATDTRSAFGEKNLNYDPLCE